MMFKNSYTDLGDIFYQSIAPEPVESPRTFLWNDRLAEELLLADKLDLSTVDLAGLFSGNDLLPGSEPIALAYAGHQFGNFVPQLGDGRAHLLGETTDRSGLRKDIQLKGSGQTTFSRNGDGRCALGPAIREFIMGEAMHALGVPSTRSLAVTATGETVYRDTPQPGAVVTRVASSHLRVGTFEYFAARNNYRAVEKLCDYAILRHYPELGEAGSDRFIMLLENVMQRQIELVVEWLRVGFIHGVMNTDNTAISGETIDYGPCAMMGVYNPETVFSSIDRQGRYAFGNQPSIAQWNMARFAETLLPLIDEDEKRAVDSAVSVIEKFSDRFQDRYLNMMTRKTGLTRRSSSDHSLITDLLDLLLQKRLDYTNSFHLLTDSLSSPSAEERIAGQLGDWYIRWRRGLDDQPEESGAVQAMMREANPLVIPRNHHMESVIDTCIESGSPDAAEVFLETLHSPYRVTARTLQYQVVPDYEDVGYQTFCGT
ncbi:MAG: protein adenylyltransferase SelO family protein [Sedimenticola sp.]